MANSTIGALNVKISADSKGLNKGLKEAGEALEASDKSLKKSSVEFSKWGAAGALAAGGIAAAIVKTNLTAIQELKNTAYAANTTVEAFERGAFAAEQFGISQEKYGDILKDVNDRVGDFLATGGGPMADFFENIAPKVDITAQSFKGLSGQQAMGLYVKSLQKANLSQQDMTFYMEAMASDSTRLIPLYKDSAKQLKAMEKQAKALGIGLSDIDVANAEAASKELKKAGALIDAIASQAVVEIAPILADMAQSFTDAAKEAGGASVLIKDSMEDVANVLEAVLIVAVGRYTGATLTATAAIIADTIATARSTIARTAQGTATAGATAKLAGFTVAQTTATTAAVAGTVAMNGLRGAMAFLGGPVGVAVMAGLAIYSFATAAEEGADKAKLNAKEVNNLTGKYEGLSRAARAATLAGLNNEMQALRGQSVDLSAELTKVNKKLKKSPGDMFANIEADKLEKEIKAVNVQLDLLSEKQALLVKPIDTSGFTSQIVDGEEVNTGVTPDPGQDKQTQAFINALQNRFKSAETLENERYSAELTRLRSSYTDKNNLTTEQQKLEASMLQEHLASVKEIRKTEEEGDESDKFIQDLKDRFANVEELEAQRYNAELTKLREHYTEKKTLTAEQQAEQNQLEQDLLSEHTLAMAEIKAAAEPIDGAINILEVLGIQYAGEEQLLIEKLAREKEILDKHLAEKKISQETFDNENLRITQATEAAKRKITVDNLKAGLQALTANSKKAQKIMQAAAIVQAVIAGKTAVIEAYRSGMQTQGPWAPVVAAAYSAAALANTASQIASIKAGGKSIGGMSGGGGGTAISNPAGASATQSAPAQQEQAARSISVDFQGSGGLLNTEQVRELIQQINEQVGDGVDLAVTGV